MKFRNIASILIALALTFSNGCDSERLDQFVSFATAGSQYAQALHKVIADAGSAMIASDSATLLVIRKQAGGGDPNAVTQNDRLLETYLDNLQKIDTHASLLGSYFSAISNLTNGKAASNTATAATGLLDSINNFNPQIEKIAFAGKNIKDFVSPGTNLVVTHFEVKILDEQLHKAAPTIDQALALQEAAVTAIAEQMKAALGASLEVRESTDVIVPYVNGPPANWNSNRESFLRVKVTIDSVDHARTAISHLRLAFKQLLENPRTSIDLSTLLGEIGKMAGYASALESSVPSKPAK
jgi:hypothetical protein